MFLSIPTPVRLKRLQQAYATNPLPVVAEDTRHTKRQSVSTSSGGSKPARESTTAASAAKGPRFSSSTVNERSGARIVARDARANVSLWWRNFLSCFTSYLTASLYSYMCTDGV